MNKYNGLGEVGYEQLITVPVVEIIRWILILNIAYWYKNIKW